MENGRGIEKEDEQDALADPPPDPFCAPDGLGAHGPRKGVLDALLRIYDDRTQRFKIGDNMLPFRPEGVAIVMGVACMGDIISFGNEGNSSDFERAYLNKIHNRHRDPIKENLFRLV